MEGIECSAHQPAAPKSAGFSKRYRFSTFPCQSRTVFGEMTSFLSRPSCDEDTGRDVWAVASRLPKKQTDQRLPAAFELRAASVTVMY